MMATNEQYLLERIASTLDQMLDEMKQANRRHEQLDQSNADAETALKDRYKNL